LNRPEKIGKYDIVDVIGRGGMGIVYKGRDPYLDRLVAIKMMTGSFSDNSDLSKRFFREAQSTASLQHPNIVTVYELGDHEGNPYLAMEYLDGESLDSILSSSQQPTLIEKLDLTLEVCRGLSYAHQRGVVHRDIKPGNIMVTRDGGVKIVDFGIAHFGDNNVTRTGQIVGSISYMSPEQVNGRPVDARTDIFSTGVVLFQLLTRYLPFEGDSPAATLLKIIDEPAPSLRNFLTTYPPELDTILGRALAKDRNLRYSSADELALDLGQAQNQLKQSLIARYIEDARRFIANNDFYKAKDQLLHVLKTDRQHTHAALLLREVQEKIQGVEISKEVEQLRAQAEEALGQEQFEAAQAAVDRALGLRNTDLELQALRDSILAAALREQNLQRAINAAESAHQSGDLDTAKDAVEQALQIAPHDTHGKALQRAIQRDWEERARQRQIENYVEQARNEITSRKFTAALELLKKAEALDAAAPQIQALIASAKVAQEQEHRRRQLQTINREIEDALNRDDYKAAAERADAGLKIFPEERSLQKLRSLAEKQRQVAERKQFVESQLAEARTLLDQGRSEELEGRLEAALAKVGNEPRLQSLLLIVHENVRRERLEKKKAAYLQNAREALRRKDYDEAVRILESARADLQQVGEIDDLLQFAKDEAASEKRRREADAATEEAHGLIAQQDFGPAIELLERTLEKIPDEELRIILGQARAGALDYEKKLQAALNTASHLIRAGKPGEALKFLDTQPASFGKKPAFHDIRDAAVKEAVRLESIEAAVRQSQQLLDREQYSSAAQALEDCRAIHGSTAELENQLADIERKRSQSATSAVEKSLRDARVLLHAAQYRAAIDRLEATSELGAFVSASLKSECETTRQHAVNGLAHQRKKEIERQVFAGELTDAADLLQRTIAELPDRKDLFELETIIQQETVRKADAQAKLAEARTLFEKADWKPGTELLKQAFAAAGRAPQVRDQVLKTFLEAADAAVEKDWRTAETLLIDVKGLEETYAGGEELSARIAERRRQEAVDQCLGAARRRQAEGDLEEAMATVERGLASYVGDPQLQELQQVLRNRIREEEERQQREREREEKEVFLHELGERLRNEPLEARTRILEDAAGKYPADVALRRQLAEARSLSKRVSELANQASTQEEAKHYRSAFRHWESIQELSPEYPGLQDQVERTRKLYNDTRAAALQNLRSRLAAGELEQARAALSQVGQEFLERDEVAAIQTQIEDAQKLRSKAEKSLAAAEKAVGKGQWQKAVELVKRACAEAPRDPVVVGVGREHLLEAFDSAIQSDWQSGNLLLVAARDMHAEPGVLASLGKRLDDKKRQEMIAGHLNEARQAEQRNDWRRSLLHIQSALQAYPGDPQLLQAKAGIERRLLAIEQERLRQQELATQREAELRRQVEEKRQGELEKQQASLRKREQQQARADQAKRAVRPRETSVTGSASAAPKPAIATGRDAASLPRPPATGKRLQLRTALIGAACVVLILGVIGIRLGTSHPGAPVQPSTNTAPKPATAAIPKTTVERENSPSLASSPSIKSPTPAASTGTLSVSVGKKTDTERLSDTLSGVNVLINGKKYGETSSDGSLQLPLEAKLYVIGVQKDGFTATRPQQVQIRLGQTSRLHFELQQSRPERAHSNSPGRIAIPAASRQSVLANLSSPQAHASDQPEPHVNNQSPQPVASASATVASAAPPSASMAVGLTENDMILATLRRLEQAYSTKDTSAVCGIWPKCPRKTFEQVFKSAQSASLSLHPLEAASISGDSASIVCTRRTVTAYAGAQQNVNEQKVTIYLRKQDDNWRIDSIK
jgi:eukaryotic-like serine/threonine-protein kinase